MPLTLYNTYTKQEEEFTPITPGEVRMYTCGPTVYGRPHIGNYSSFLMADLLRRWLEAGHGYRVTHVKNITDVGHLVADGDEGEDKVEKQAREEFGEVNHDSVLAIARKYEEQYLADERALNFVEPEYRPRATEYINQMKQMIEALLESGEAYVTEDGIYFAVESFADYGRLSGNTLENLDAGSRVQRNESKRHPADFALWKFCVGPNEHHVLRWPSPGQGNPEGFPGWHIECSAMSRDVLGDQIDIHTGGEDNIFPHHECEIAQTESVTDAHPFAKLWLHRRRINMGEEKMSKSLGNVLTLDAITEQGFHPLDVRYYLLSVHYRTQLKFTQKGLEDARLIRRRIVEGLEHADEISNREPTPMTGSLIADQLKNRCDEFKDAMNSDLNTPKAIAVILDFVSLTNSYDNIFGKDVSEYDIKELREFVSMIRSTFGCFEPESDEEVPAEVQNLLDQRAAARASKDYALSDDLRDQLQALGYEVRDAAGEQIVKKM